MEAGGASDWTDRHRGKKGPRPRDSRVWHVTTRKRESFHFIKVDYTYFWHLSWRECRGKRPNAFLSSGKWPIGSSAFAARFPPPRGLTSERTSQQKQQRVIRSQGLGESLASNKKGMMDKAEGWELTARRSEGRGSRAGRERADKSQFIGVSWVGGASGSVSRASVAGLPLFCSSGLVVDEDGLILVWRRQKQES